MRWMAVDLDTGEESQISIDEVVRQVRECGLDVKTTIDKSIYRDESITVPSPVGGDRLLIPVSECKTV